MKLGRVVIAGLGAWNYLINRRVPPQAYVAANLVVSAALVAVGARHGTAEQLGLRRGRGFGAGLAAAATVAGGSLVASRLQATARLFEDERASADDVAYQTLVRIPLGTVVLEEIAFRSVLPVLLEGPERRAASLRGAVLFGLWHVIPTLNTLDINEVRDPARRAKAVAGGVAATAVAGWMFDRLRLRAGSVLAPMLAHWSANAVSYAIAARRRPHRDG